MPESTGEDFAAVAAIIVIGRVTDEVGRFRSAVEAYGVSLVPLGSEPAGAPIVVIIVDGTAAAIPDGLPVDGEVLPVSLDSVLSPLFPHLSHLVPSTVGWDAAAERLASTIRYGGQGILEWARLVSSAQEWKENRSSSTLTVAQQMTAVAALGSRIAAAQPNEAMFVRAYLAGSAAHTRRVRRITSTVLAAVGAVLVAAIVLATTQAIGAKLAGDQSLVQANNATAVRISAEAVASIGSDPDLSMVLSQRALELSRSPTVRNAVGAVASSAVAHESYPIDTVPWGIGVSDDGHSAVASYETSTVELLSPTGEVERVVRYLPENEPWELAAIALSPDHSTLVVTTAEGISIFSTKDGNPAPGLIPDTKGWDPSTWSGSDRLLVTGPRGAAVLNTVTADMNPLPGAPHGASIIGMSQNREYLAAATDNQLQVIETATGAAVHSIDLAGVRGIAVSNDGAMVVARLQFGVELVRWDGTDHPQTRTLHTEVQPLKVIPLGPNYFAVAWIDGWVSIVAAAPSASHNSSLDNEIVRFPAHSEGLMFIGSTASGDLITAGFDRFLRVWNTGKLDGFWHTTSAGVTTPSGGLVPGLGVSGGLDGFPAAAINNQIRYTTDGRLALALRSAADVLSMYAIDDPKPKNSFLGVFSRPFLSDDGRSLVTVAPGDPWKIRVQKLSPTPGEWVDPKPTLSFQTTLPVQSTGLVLGPVLIAVSKDAESVAIATSTGVRTWTSASTDPSSTTFNIPSKPLSIVIGDNGARVITSDGILHEPDGSSRNLVKMFKGAGEQVGGIVAATFNGSTVLVLADTGAVASVDRRHARIVLPRGLVAGAGTLRTSADGKRIAAVGPDCVSLIDISSKSIVGRWNNIAGVRVDDVAFSRDGKSLAMVSASSQVALVQLRAVADPAVVVAPRSLTKDENSLYALEATVG